jgi:RHS repeat-associated protein
MLRFLLLALLGLVAAGAVVLSRRTSTRGASAAVPAPGPTPAPIPAPIPVPAPPAAGLPEVHIFPPPDDMGPVVPVTFLVTDPNSDPVDLVAEYSKGGGTFSAATLAAGTDSIAHVPASYRSVDYRLLWNAAADVGSGVQQTLTFRITPRKQGIAGTSDEATFHVDTTPFGPLPANTALPVVAADLKIDSGDAQKGLAGQFFADPLRVRVLDPSNQPLAGATVSVHLIPAAGASAEVVEDPYTGATTDASGAVAVRVRPSPTMQGALKLEARVTGVPSLSRTFNLTVNKPAIVPDASNPTGPLQYGNAIELRFRYDGDGDPTTVDYAPAPDRSVRFKVEATNADISHREVICPDGFAGGNGCRFHLVPTTLDTAVSVTVTSVDDPTVKYTGQFAVSTPANQNRLTAIQPVYAYDPVTLYLKVVHAVDPATQQQMRGYPGLPIDAPFRVQIVDRSGQEYNLELASPISGCGTVSTNKLGITWYCPSGFFATSATAGIQHTLTAPYDQDVFFTPQDAGPWLISATPAGTVADPKANTFTWVDSSGQQQCMRVNGFFASIQRNFYVQLPDFELQDSTTRQAVFEVKAGLRAVIAVKNLTKFATGGTPEDVPANGTRIDFSDAPLYTGSVPGPYKQKLPLTATPPTTLVSPTLLITSGDPQYATAPPGVIQSVLPRAWLVFDPAGVRLIYPTGKSRRGRRVIGGESSPQETVVGTSPFEGFDSSLQLCSGEFVRSTADLSFLTRGGEIVFGRTFRDHLTGEGILGPGWIGSFEACLDMTLPWGIRRIDALGRVHDFVGQAVPKGLYVEINTNLNLDADHGAVNIQDRFGTFHHYNADGTLKFIEDRNKNRTTFRYDETARLIEVEDPLKRVTKFIYYPDVGAVKEIRGKLAQIKDFASRTVDFVYYDGTDPAGRAGWLKSCLRPPAPTMVGAAEQPNYRRGEIYKYVLSTDPALDGSLYQILDSELNTLVTNGYTPQRKMDNQTYGRGTLKLKYTPAEKKIEITDRKASRRTWKFKVSPAPDGSTPESIVETANGKRPGGTDTTTTMTHNVHGELTLVTFPGGAKRVYVYEDNATSPRSFGNLRMVTDTGTNGDVRFASWEYEHKFNQVARYFHPEGFRLNLHKSQRTYYDYDGQGNLTDISNPRTLFAVLVKNAAGNDELRWVHDQHRHHVEYNAYGLAKSVEDPQGVVTAFEYHPIASPSGGGTPSADEGGFLATTTRDAQTSTRRDNFFPAVGLVPLKTSMAYSPQGDIQSWIDCRGTGHKVDCNALRQVTSIIYANSVPAGSGGTAPMLTETFHYGPNGVLVQRQAKRATGSPLIATAINDSEGRPIGRRLSWEPGTEMSKQCSRDMEGFIEAVYPEQQAGATLGDPENKVVLDERAIPVSNTYSPNLDALEFGLEIEDTGAPAKLTLPGGDFIGADHDPFGGLASLIDRAGNSMFGLKDFADRFARVAFRSGLTQDVLGFEEYRMNELGRMRRCHTSLLAHDLTGTYGSFPIPSPIDGYPTGPWPPVSTSVLDDQGQWGRGDGRHSEDYLLDPNGLLVRAVDDENRVHNLVRNPHGTVVGGFDDASHVVRHLPNAAGDVGEIEIDEYSTDPQRPASRTLRWKAVLDDLAQPVAIIDAGGNALRAEYSEDGSIRAVTDSIGKDSTAPPYNGHQINEKGNRTIYTRDDLGRIRKFEIALTSDGMGGSSPELNPFNTTATVAREFEYDASGRLTTIVDLAKNRMEWQYESNQGGRCKGMKHAASAAAPNGAAAVFTYDTQGRPETWTDPNGTTTKLSYDAESRIEKMTVQTRGPGVGGVDGYEFTYDSLTRIRTAFELGKTSGINFGWTFIGDLLEQGQGALMVASTFDGTGQRKTLQYPSNGPLIEAQYDSDGRLRQLTRNGGPFISYEYIGKKTLLGRRAGPVSLQCEYDDAGRLKRQYLDAGTLEFTTACRRDGRFNNWSRKAGPLAETRAWQYDSACRIVREDAAYAAGRPLQSLTVVRKIDGDGAIRRITRTETTTAGTSTTTIDQAREERGRIVMRGTTPIRYDANGNLINDGSKAFFYDFLDRLVHIKDLRSAVDTYYSYDALGRCTAMSNGTLAEQYVYDGWQLIEVRSGMTVRERYYYGRSPGEAAAMEVAGQLYYLVPAPEGSIDSVVDAQGNVVETYDYSLTGERVVLDAARKPKPGNPRPICRLGFHGHVHEFDTGLIDVRHRRLHTGIGHFLTADPMNLVKSGNLYAYASNDPVNLVDRYGLEDDGIDWREAAVSFIIPLGIVAAVAVGAFFFPVIIPFLAPIGCAFLATMVTLHTVNRLSANQGFFTSLLGGVLDSVGVSGVLQGGFQFDLATGEVLKLTPQQRGQLLGGGLGTLAAFGLGIMIFRGGGQRITNARARFDAWRTTTRTVRTLPSEYPRTAMVLRARPQTNTNRGWGPEMHGRVYHRPIRGFPETISIPGRLPTLETAVDAITLRLHSMPRPGMPFREAALIRLGTPDGGDLTYMTPLGAGDRGGIPPGVEEAIYRPIRGARADVDVESGRILPDAQGPRSPGLVDEYPQLLVRGRMHTHPPYESNGVPGHSQWSRYTTGGDDVFLDFEFGCEPLRARLEPGAQAIVVRIGLDGAPEDVGIVELAPPVPRASASTRWPPIAPTFSPGPSFRSRR